MAKQESNVAVYDITIRAEGHEVDEVKAWANAYFKKWCFQLEKGAETGYMHYQFRGSLKVKKRPGPMKSLLRETFEGHCCPTSTNSSNDEFYAMKEDTREEGPWTDRDEYVYIPIDMRFTPVWNEMQQRMVYIMNTDPNRRHVNCLVDGDGFRGKSFLAMWMYAHGYACYIPFFTEAKDLMRMVHGLPRRKSYFIDLPRALSHKAEHEIYGGIEQLKTGIIYDDRYKFRMEAIDPVHVFVFTNRMPNLDLISNDRWKIWVLPSKRGKTKD
jgi:hypothetical protein